MKPGKLVITQAFDLRLPNGKNVEIRAGTEFTYHGDPNAWLHTVGYRGKSVDIPHGVARILEQPTSDDPRMTFPHTT